MKQKYLIFLLTLNLCALKTKFVFDPKEYKIPTPKTVSIAGTFNHWNKDMNFLKPQPDGTFVIELDLEEGMHYYKFVVDGKTWLEDVRADKRLRAPDGFGGFNSGVIVGESGLKYAPAVANKIVKNAVKHNQNEIEYYNYIPPDLLEVKLRTLENDVEKAVVVINGKEHKMEEKINKLHFDFYHTLIEISEKLDSYYFVVIDGKETLYYGQDGFSTTIPSKPFKISRVPIFSIPDWITDAIFYQIMLDRFYNADKTNDPPNTLPWGFDFSKRAPHERGHFYEFVWGRNFGGDLQGLTEKLSYLMELGITAIYLTPVFEAEAYHKYNTSDYKHIDDNFGFKGDILEVKEDPLNKRTWKFTKTDKLFIEFLEKAHENGIRVIIDGVFNHSGEHFWAFMDLKRKHEKSKYKNWYIVTDWQEFKEKAHLGRGYVGWGGFGGLPEYNEDEKGLVSGIKEHIIDITKRWMDPDEDGNTYDGVDGWRLDVPDCVRKPFWIEWCKVVRTINPQAYIVGELWHEAPDWLNQKLFHAQMNYPLARAVVKFFIDEVYTPSQFDKELKRLRNLYPWQVNLAQLNLFDSHDTDRLVSMIYNPKREYDKRNRLDDKHKGPDFNPLYKNTKPTEKEYGILKLIAAFQFTYVGVPCIWYGTEAGMWGADDPWNRLPMVWKELVPYENEDIKFMDDVYEHYRKLIAIRLTYPQFRKGLIQTVLVDDKKSVFAFKRKKEDKIGIVVFNNSGSKQTVVLAVPEKVKFYDVLNEKKYEIVREGNRNKILVRKPSKIFIPARQKIKVTLPPKSASILVN